MIHFLLLLSAALSDYMPIEVQQQTGITSLTRAQQEQLTSWLAQNMSAQKHQKTESVSLAENYHGGRVLQLTDQTIWEVAPQDVTYTALWITPFPIQIGTSSDPTYPNTLTNLTSGTTVRVRQIDTINPPDIPKEPQLPPGEQKQPETIHPQQEPIKPKHHKKTAPKQQQLPGELNETYMPPDQLPGLPAPQPGQ